MSVRILIGDCIEMLRTLPNDSVDCCVTSPPYWGLRDYGVDGQIGLERSLGEHLEVMVSVFEEVRRVLKPAGTLWLNYGDCYASAPNGRSAADTKAAGNDDRTFRDKPFSTVGGVLKPKDLCMVPNRLAIALQEAGWWVRSEIIWAKPNPMPDSSGKYRPSTSHEKIFMLSKSGRCYYDAAAVAQAAAASTSVRLNQDLEKQAGSDRAYAGKRANGAMKAVGNSNLNKRARDLEQGSRPPNSRPHNLSKFEADNGGEYETRYLRNYEPAPLDAWEIATEPFKGAHFATFPTELAKRCILAGCPAGGTVLDPFGGAGTTGLVSDRLQRDAILIELNPEYAEMARRRIEGDAPMFTDVSA